MVPEPAWTGSLPPGWACFYTQALSTNGKHTATLHYWPRYSGIFRVVLAQNMDTPDIPKKSVGRIDLSFARSVAPPNVATPGLEDVVKTPVDEPSKSLNGINTDLSQLKLENGDDSGYDAVPQSPIEDPFPDSMQKSFRESLDKSFESPLSGSLGESFGQPFDESFNESLGDSLNDSLGESLGDSMEQTDPEYDVQNLQIDEVEPPVISDPPSPEVAKPVGEEIDFGEFDGAGETPPSISPVPESPSSNGTQFRATENMRARAEEINSGSKVVPRVEITQQDYFGMAIEFESWFSLAQEQHHWVLHRWMEALRLFDDSETTPKALLTIFDGLKAPVNSAVGEITRRVHPTLESLGINAYDIVLSEDFNSHTLLFVYLCAQIESKELLLDRGVPLITELMEQVSLMRWMLNDEEDLEEEANSGIGGGSGDQNGEREPDTVQASAILPRLLALLRLSILASLGDSEELKSVRNQMFKNYDLKVPEDGSSELVSPINYAVFMDDIERRYPAFVHLPDENHKLGAQLKDNMISSFHGDDQRILSSDPVSLNEMSHHYPQSEQRRRGSSLGSDPNDPAALVGYHRSIMPYVPESIVEACELLKSNVCPTPQMLQLYEEILHLRRRSNEQPKTASEAAPPQINAVKSIYHQTLEIQKSFIRVTVDKLLYSGFNDGPGLGSHAALSSVCLLLQWFEVSHVLMFEHMSAILFDCQFHFAAHIFCQRYPKILHSILSDYTCTGSSVFWKPLLRSYEGGPQLKWTEDGLASDLIIEDCNRLHLQTYTHLMTILRLMIVGKAQRILVVTEMMVDPIKELFNIHEPKLWSEILQYFKAQIPFTGKRWRYLNIELISAIYLYCPSRLDDNWLSGSDITSIMRNAGAEEEELRRLIHNYNDRHY